MQVTILGTAAAEGWPAIFCGCDTCRRAREAGGKNNRSRASLQAGPKHKIDLPPDTWYHEAHLGADLSRLEYLFITHSHPDHLSLDQLDYLDSPFAHCHPLPLNIYGNDASIRRVREKIGQNEGKVAVLAEVESFMPIHTGEMTFIPVTASHAPGEHCLNYVVEAGGRRLLYANDTGYFPEETWDFLEGKHLDCVICECTDGPNPGGVYHMDFEHMYAVKQRLEEIGSLSGGPFIATHFSHNVGLLHHELEDILSEHGIMTAYDGLQIAL